MPVLWVPLVYTGVYRWSASVLNLITLDCFRVTLKGFVSLVAIASASAFALLSASSFSANSSFFSSLSSSSTSMEVELSVFLSACLAFDLAVVESTAVLTRTCFFSFFSSRGLGYSNSLRSASQSTAKSTGMSRCTLTPMSAVGTNESDSMCIMGYQYQYCAHSIIPTTAGGLVKPVRDMSSIVTLRPPASRIPVPRIAPMRAIVGECFASAIVSESLVRSAAARVFTAGFSCIKSIDEAMYAPWRTKSTLSSLRCSRS
mmetsp:Transcript_780/g.1156  ORF Transcript_780/g.1156 Transcript_780/m.1156 type:complete len:259 (-) Transcript_780:1188-1964(-)